MNNIAPPSFSLALTSVPDTEQIVNYFRAFLSLFSSHSANLLKSFEIYYSVQISISLMCGLFTLADTSKLRVLLSPLAVAYYRTVSASFRKDPRALASSRQNSSLAYHCLGARAVTRLPWGAEDCALARCARPLCSKHYVRSVTPTQIYLSKYA